MSWQQIKLHTTAQHSESLEELLLQLGAVSISFLDAKDQPLFQIEPGSTVIWDATILVALFEEKTDLSFCLAMLATKEEVLNRTALVIEELADQDWERAWMDDFTAMQFGKNLWICPSWQTPPQPEAVNILLDPGLAFGSGTHATTSLCLQWLEGAGLAGKTVIDFGCGSGVLAIAAALLGAELVYAYDNDPQAVTATIDNSQRNQIKSTQLFVALSDQLQEMKADVLVANILAAPLHDLAPTLAKRVKVGGQIVLSGILEEQASAIIESYSTWFDMLPATVKDGWTRIEGTRK